MAFKTKYTEQTVLGGEVGLGGLHKIETGCWGHEKMSG
jgi:hypothetical protein